MSLWYSSKSQWAQGSVRGPCRAFLCGPWGKGERQRSCGPALTVGRRVGVGSGNWAERPLRFCGIQVQTRAVWEAAPRPLLHAASAEPRPTALVSCSCFSLLRHCLPRQPAMCVYSLCQWRSPWESRGHAVNKGSVWRHCVCSGPLCRLHSHTSHCTSPGMQAGSAGAVVQMAARPRPSLELRPCVSTTWTALEDSSLVP